MKDGKFLDLGRQKRITLKRKKTHSKTFPLNKGSQEIFGHMESRTELWMDGSK